MICEIIKKIRCFSHLVNTDYVNQLRYNSSVHKDTNKRIKLNNKPELTNEQANVLLDNSSEPESKNIPDPKLLSPM